MKSYRVILFIFALIFLALYLPVLGRPFEFEELRLTSFFHSQPDKELLVFLPELESGSRYDKMATDYLKLNPPGLLYFYRLWSWITTENEFLMRLPLFILILLSLKSLFKIFESWSTKEEASLYLFLFGVFPIWFRPLVTLTPSAFNFCLTVLSLQFFYRSLKRNNFKSVPLWTTNLVGLLVSYHFIAIILIQIGVSFFKREFAGQKPFAFFKGGIVLLIVGLYFSKPEVSDRNPLVFYWSEVKFMDSINVMKSFILGSIL